MKFVAFRTLIENEIGNPQTADASSTRMRQLILQWTQNVYNEIGRKGNWSWLQGLKADATLAVGVRLMAIPSTVKTILDVMDLSQLPPLPLALVLEHQYWANQYELEQTGIPEFAHFWGNNLYFDKAPSSIWDFQYRYIGRVETLSPAANDGLGTEILLPETETDIAYEGVLAYAMRYKRDPAWSGQFSLYQSKLNDYFKSDRKGPGCFYPEKNQQTSRDTTTFRVVIP